jgi:aryl-alcohol dehydrogenase-like predicted oxidoreductase
MTGQLPRRTLGHTGIPVSALALGGHEYLADGRLKGFGDDFENAVLAGYRRSDFGGPARRAIVTRALARGVNYFDVTIDPEVEALGRTLRSPAVFDVTAMTGVSGVTGASGPAAGAESVLVQARPQGLCYRYDPGNPGLVRPGVLRAEVRRLAELLGRGRVDVLNLGLEREALDPVTGRPDYLKALAEILTELRADGLVGLVACDSLFSGESQYVTLIESGCFDVVWLTFGPLTPAPAEVVLPRAREAGLGVVAREAFGKGALFRFAAEAGVAAGEVAGAAQRWVLSHAEVGTLAVGVRTADEFDRNADAATRPYTDADRTLLDRVLATDAARAAVTESTAAFRP